ncbi:unnamed protein product, partial [Choristocarpus tenellus]
GGWNIKLVTQPAQSPDLNINHLAFFPTLISGIWRERYSTIDDLVKGGKSTYRAYSAVSLERVWQSLFKRYNQVLKVLGGNYFEVQHTGTKK